MSFFEEHRKITLGGILAALLFIGEGAYEVWKYYHPQVLVNQPKTQSPLDTISVSEITEIQRQVDFLRDSLYQLTQNLTLSEEERRITAMKVDLLQSLLVARVQDNILLQVRSSLYNGDYSQIKAILIAPATNETNALAQWHLQTASLDGLDGNFESAGDHYIKAIELQPENLYFFQNVVNVLDSAQRYSEALTLLEKVKDSIKADATDLDKAAFLITYGKIYNRLKQYPKALEVLEEALNIYKNTKGDQAEEVAFCYSNIAATSACGSNYSMAIENYAKAVAIDTLHPDYLRINLADNYEGIARIYSKNNSDNEAIPYYEKALDLLIKSFGEKHSKVGAAYNNLAVAYWRSKNKPMAIQFYNKALHVFEEIHGPKSSTAITVRKNLYQIENSI